MKRISNLFHKRQYMISSEYELFLYSDPANLQVCPHTHNFYEIYYLLSDSIDFVIGNQVYNLKSGDFLLLPPGLMHYPSLLKIVPGQMYKHFVLWCSLPFFEHFVNFDNEIGHMWDAVKENTSYHIRPSASASQILHSHFLRLLDEQQQPGYGHRTMIYSLLGELLTEVNRIVFNLEHFEKHAPISTLFNNILYYIHTHLTEELSLEILSNHFFVSKGYISKVFKDYLGVSVYQYVLSLRLEGTRNAILAGTSISKAAETFGFHDYSCFFRSFKKSFLMSPKEFQESICEKNRAV